MVLKLPHGFIISVTKLHIAAQQMLTSTDVEQLWSDSGITDLKIGVADPPKIKSGLGQEFFGNLWINIRADRIQNTQTRKMQCSGFWF